MKTISEALVFAVVYIAGAPATDDEREDDDVSALEQVGAILQEATPAERKALRAAVDIALKRSNEPQILIPNASRTTKYLSSRTYQNENTDWTPP